MNTSSTLVKRAAVLIGLTAACGSDTAPAETAHSAHWSYAGLTGPNHWSTLDSAYANCEGAAQTPIDFPAGSLPGSLQACAAHYAPSALTLFNNGHTVQVNYDAGSWLSLDGGEYALVQFHFHAHSEHTVAGRAYPLELHLVHANAGGQLAVVGVFIEPGAENPVLGSVFDHLPATPSEPTTLAGVEVDASRLLPVETWSWRYTGSLTTPPCSENVLWTVLAQAISASPAQIAQVTAIYADNHRPTQPLNSRALQSAPWVLTIR